MLWLLLTSWYNDNFFFKLWKHFYRYPNLEDVPDLFDEVEGAALSDGVDEQDAVCPGEGLYGGQVLHVAGTQVADLEDDGVSVHQHLVLVPGLRLVIVLADVALRQEPHHQSWNGNEV